MGAEDREPFDLVVIGGGLGGLATAALARRRGRRVALLEAHTKLGGCAGYFERGPYTFDAGATALMGLGPAEPIGALLAEIGLEFRAERTAVYRVHLPDRTLDVDPDPARFEAASAAAFPGLAGADRRFWRLQAAVGDRLFRVAARLPRLPFRTPGDVLQAAGALGVGGTMAAATSLLTVDAVLRALGLRGDRAFRALVAMLLQDTAQAGPDTVPFANAAACLQAYRRGLARPRGGMRALMEGIGERFAATGGDLRTGTLVDRVEPDPDAPGGFLVTTRRRHRLRARQVAFNLPLDLAARLLGRPLDDRRLGRAERNSRARWSAVTAYAAIRREALPDAGPLFHQVLHDYDAPIHGGNNVLVSLSPAGDPGYGPEDVRVATLSTHTPPEDWDGLDRPGHEALKDRYAARLRQALRRAIPDVDDALLHIEFASPRAFARYTRRTRGAVGGPPVSRGNANLRAVHPGVLGPGLWVVGDSVFPGQGTMAVVLSAMRVANEVAGPRVAGEVAPARPADRPVEAVGGSC
jgi:C-3',4' desaturase CrtD